MIELNEDPPVYEKVIHYDAKKQERVMLTINPFRGTEYLHLRRYYQDFEEEWLPTKQGVSMELDFDNARNLFEGLVEIISLAESKNILETHFADVLDRIYPERNKNSS